MAACSWKEHRACASRSRCRCLLQPLPAPPAVGRCLACAEPGWWWSFLLRCPGRRAGLRPIEALKPGDIAFHFANKNRPDEIFSRKHARLRAQFPQRPGHLDLHRRPFHALVGADAGLPGRIGLHFRKVEIGLHPHRAVSATKRSTANFQRSVVDCERILRWRNFKSAAWTASSAFFLTASSVSGNCTASKSSALFWTAAGENLASTPSESAMEPLPRSTDMMPCGLNP